MPLYEYHCRSCGHRFDLLVPVSKADARPPCPCCGSKGTEKQVSAFASRTGGCAGAPGRSPFS